MKRFLLLILISMMAINIAACNKTKQPTQKTAPKILTISPLPSSKTLYFSGLITPLEALAVLSPTDGLIENISFSYGQKVTKGQLLLSIRSLKQQSDFQAALTKYLQAKQTFEQSKAELTSDTKLFDDGLISRNTFRQTQSTFLLNQLALLQAKGQLAIIATDQNINQIENLSIENIDAVNKALELDKTATLVKMLAPASGEALFETTNAKKIIAGSSVKEGQILLYLNASEGISITININEINVNQLSVGQPAIITSVAFPDITLQGYIKSIDAQATSDSSIPTFSATVVVPKLTKAQEKIIHVGMSAKIAITSKNPPQILVPIYAVFQNNDKSMLNLFDPTTGKITPVVVQTGETTLNDVSITSGLKPGDQVVLPN